MLGKITLLAELGFITENLRLQGKTIVFTNGCFDLIHAGHIRSLQKAKEFGDILIVGVNSDESVRALKGDQRPIISLSHRCEVLAALEAVDYVVTFHEETASKVIASLKPHYYVKAGYARGELPETPIVEKVGCKISLLPLTEEPLSTSLIIQKIKSFT